MARDEEARIAVALVLPAQADAAALVGGEPLLAAVALVPVEAPDLDRGADDRAAAVAGDDAHVEAFAAPLGEQHEVADDDVDGGAAVAGLAEVLAAGSDDDVEAGLR